MSKVRIGLLAVSAVVMSLIAAANSRAANFILSPEESYLSISGQSRPQYNSLPVSSQAAGSLTAALSGSLSISQWTTTALRINDGWINPVQRSGPYQPFNWPAAFAGMVANFSGTNPGYFLIQDGYSPLYGVLPSSGSPGRFQVNQTTMVFASQTMSGVVAPEIYPYGDTINGNFDNLATTEASLSVVDGRYRIEIPIATRRFDTMQGRLELDFSGRIVAYADENPALTPGVASGRFETSYGWTRIPNSSVAISTSVGNYLWTTEPQEWGAARLKPSDSSETLHQMVLGTDMLLPDTQYQVTFDISNQGVENNYPLTGDLDRFGSAEVYLALGSPNRSGEFDAAGGIYRLANVAEIPDGEWRRGESFVFDTSFLTAEQLRQEVYLVLRGTNWEGGSSIGFDNISLAIVPEPPALGLSLFAFLGLAGRQMRRRRMVRSTAATSQCTTNARACG